MIHSSFCWWGDNLGLGIRFGWDDDDVSELSVDCDRSEFKLRQEDDDDAAAASSEGIEWMDILVSSFIVSFCDLIMKERK